MRQATLLAMNADIWYMVAEHIKDPCDLIHMAMTCSELYAIYTSDRVWRYFDVYGLEQNILKRFVADKPQINRSEFTKNLTQQLVSAIRFGFLPERLEMIDRQLLWCMLRLVDPFIYELPNDTELALKLFDLFPRALVGSVAIELYGNREICLRLLDREDLDPAIMYQMEMAIDPNDKELVLKLIQMDHNHARAASPELIASREFIQLIQLNPMLLQYGPEHLKHDTEFLETCDFSTNPHAIKYTAYYIRYDTVLASKLIGAEPCPKHIESVYELFGARKTAYIYRNMGVQVAAEAIRGSIFRKLCPFLYTTKEALLNALPISRHAIMIPPDLRNDQQVILTAFSREDSFKYSELVENISEDTMHSQEFRDLARQEFFLFERAKFLHSDVQYLESLNTRMLLPAISKCLKPEMKNDTDLIVHLLNVVTARERRCGTNIAFMLDDLSYSLGNRIALLVWYNYSTRMRLGHDSCILSRCSLDLVDECPRCNNLARPKTRRNLASPYLPKPEIAPWHRLDIRS